MKVAYKEVLIPWITQPGKNIRLSIWFPTNVNLTSPAEYRIDPCPACDTFIPIAGNDIFGVPKLPQLTSVSSVVYNSDIAYNGSNLFPECRYPIIISSHGANTLPWFEEYSRVMIAKAGFIVIAPWHTGFMFKDILFGTNSNLNATLTKVEQIKFSLLPWISSQNSDLNSGFYKKLNINSMGIYGFSAGAEVAIRYVQLYPNDFKVLYAGEPNFGVVDDNITQITIPSFLETASNALLTTTQPRDATKLYPIFKSYYAGKKMMIEIQGANHTTSISDIINNKYLIPLLTKLTSDGFSPSVYPPNGAFSYAVTNTTISTFNSQSVTDPSKPITPQQEREIIASYSVNWLSYFLKCGCERETAKFGLGLCYAQNQRYKVVLYYKESIQIPFNYEPIKLTTTINV